MYLKLAAGSEEMKPDFVMDEKRAGMTQERKSPFSQTGIVCRIRAVRKAVSTLESLGTDIV